MPAATTETVPLLSPTPTHSQEEPGGEYDGGTEQDHEEVDSGPLASEPYIPPTGENREADCESNPSPVLTSHITDLSQISAIQPTSVISGNWYKNRSYLNIDAEHGGTAPSVTIYAPAAAEITGITYYLQPMSDVNGNWVDVPQYDIRLRISCEVTYGFDHISELAEGVVEFAPEEPSTSTRDAEVRVSISVKAGDVLGYTTGTILAHSWDFIFSNTAARNTFANQERYENTGDLNNLLHAECPYDYFEGDMGDEYRALFGGANGRTGGADCDTSFDVPGSIYGGWFQTPYDDADPFAMADWGMAIAVMPDGNVRINGESVSVRLGPQDETYTDPRTVADQHCFVSARGTGGRNGWHVFLRVLTFDTVAVAFDEGSCPSSLPKDHTVYYR